MRKLMSLIVLMTFVLPASNQTSAAPLQISTFKTDITPPMGSPLCDGACTPASSIDHRLSANGTVIFTDKLPIVICALDWVGVGNGGYQQFREALATAAGTTVNRVALHCLHQHDAPGADFEAEAILADAGISGAEFDPVFARSAISNIAGALTASLAHKQTVTHIGTGTAIVDRVASTRRCMDPTGTFVKYVRYSSCTDPVIIAQPEGIIDPKMRLISFWNEDQPLASMTHYATHPQSYYNKGRVSYDFVGMARVQREGALPDVAHMHLNGAGGDVVAGKYNRGWEDMTDRQELADRMANGMADAWDNQELVTVDSSDVSWAFEPVILPPREYLNETTLLATVNSTWKPIKERIRAARELAFLRRMNNGQAININCLNIGQASVLYMPGELFVEYQLAAQDMAPDRFVAMAAYGDYGPGYIGTEISYTQGGYETGYPARVGPGGEAILMPAMDRLLNGAVPEPSAIVVLFSAMAVLLAFRLRSRRAGARV